MSLIKITSGHRTVSTETPANFKITMQTPLDGRYRLVEALIPISQYDITSANNTVQWLEAASKTATIPVGYYTPQTLATAVATAINGATASGSTFTGTFSSVTRKITFTNTLSTAVRFFANSMNTVGPALGFTGGETDISNGGNKIAMVSPLLSYNISINARESVTDAKGNSWSFTIPITGNSGDYILYHPSPSYVPHVTLSRASVLDVRVTDDTSAIILLLTDWYMVLDLVC